MTSPDEHRDKPIAITLAQMIAGGIDLIWSPVEVAFVQNLIYYIGRAYRTREAPEAEESAQAGH